nr:hypothetical protein [Candidatus Cloacimonadota bacterium]
MKKVILILILMLMMIGLSALEYDISGAIRFRAVVANDEFEDDGGWVDNRFNIGFDSQFHKYLKFRIAAEIGDITWGNGGGGINTGANINIRELFVKPYIELLDADVSIGQLYWKDKMGLVMDDYFSGVIFHKDINNNLSTELAWMKVEENALYNSDDMNVILAHASMNTDVPYGAYIFYGVDNFLDLENLTLMPYMSMDMDKLNFDATVFLDLQMDDDTDVGLGAAVKTGLMLDDFEIGADILVATENGLTTISPWYQNGLYIYGIGEYHDRVNLYWNTPYDGNEDFFASIVGRLKAPINEKIKAFGAAGYLIDLGTELNVGLEYELIPDLSHVAAYFATGFHDNDTFNYILGTSLQVEF